MDRIDLERYLEKNSVEGELIFTGISVHSTKDSSKALEIDESETAKSLIFIVDGKPVMVIVPGDKKADEERIKKVRDAESCRLAEKEEVIDATGYSIGEVPPIGSDIPVIMDKSLMKKKEVYAGGGSDRYLLKISPEEIEGCNDADIEDVAE